MVVSEALAREIGQPVRQMSQDVNISRRERWISGVAGGALLLYGTKRPAWEGRLMMIAGGGLLHRAITGRCLLYKALRVNTAATAKSEVTSVSHNEGIKIARSVTINRPVEELYRFWRNFENLPAFTKHLESVQVRDRCSHWVVKAPAGKTVEWDAEIHNDIENELIAWRSLENAAINNAGSVSFRKAPEGRGTEVKVVINYEPPFGVFGSAIAKLFGEEPELQLGDDLRRFKQLMETGEIPTTSGQSSGRH
jgi:uncharacterized membrane protein